MKKVYLVMKDYSQEYNQGSWDGDTEIDTAWTNKKYAKNRVRNLSEELIEHFWYFQNMKPEEDYKETWAKDKTRVDYDMGDELYSYYIKEMETDISDSDKLSSDFPLIGDGFDFGPDVWES